MGRRARIFLLLAALTSSVYLLTYRARIESGDTLRALDAMTSQSRYGDWLMDESAWFKAPLRIRGWTDYPLGEYDVEERLNITLATPLLKLAESLPRLGNIHVVWLFNIIIAPLTVGLIYLCLREMAYDDWTAVAVALGAGFASNLWAYSQTFFREPLVGFLLLLAVYSILVTRDRHIFIRLAGVLVGLLAVYLSVAAKSSAVLATVAIGLFAMPMPGFLNNPLMRRGSALFLLMQVFALFPLMFAAPLEDAFVGQFSHIAPDEHYFAYALRIFLLSPGGSLWGTSPFLLLSLAGGILLLRRGQHRLVWMIWLLVAGYAMGHALATGPHWFGGLSWPPRFLTPVIPIMALGCAAAVESILARSRPWMLLGLAGLTVYGAWIQFSGVSLSLRHYTDSLPAESHGVAEWEPGLTQPRYFRWAVLPHRWADLGFDFVWIRASAPWWAFAYTCYSLALALLLMAHLRGREGPWRLAAPFAVFLGIPLLLVNLWSIYDRDTLTRSQMPALHDAFNYLAENAVEEDVLLLPNNLYAEFTLNHMDESAPRTIILPQALAQAASERQPAQAQSSSPHHWFDVFTFRALHHLAHKRDRLFLLANTNAFMRWSFRPYERYLSMFFYPMGEIALEHADETARLLEYSVRYAAPNPLSLYLGEQATDLVYGEHIRLRSVVMPGGEDYRPGESLELSLLWQTGQALKQDYTVAWFVAEPDTGQVIAQGWDSGPQAGFAPTSSWRPGAPVWDNRALRLPAETASGDYEMWVILYWHDAGTGELKRLKVSGANVKGAGTIGVLPFTVRVTH